MPDGLRFDQERSFNQETDPYDRIEVRADTNDLQRSAGDGALASLRDQRIRSDTLAVPGTQTVAAALFRGFHAAGGNKFNGQVVQTPADLAALALVD